MQALTGITSRLDRVQSFLDDKIADTPLADRSDDDAAQRKEEEAAVAARRRLAATKSADAVKDELLGAVQDDDDDDDDDLETDALKAENARLKREVRSLTTDLEAAERDGKMVFLNPLGSSPSASLLTVAGVPSAEQSMKRDVFHSVAGRMRPLLEIDAAYPASNRKSKSLSKLAAHVSWRQTTSASAVSSCSLRRARRASHG